jgi:hypothetical protein
MDCAGMRRRLWGREVSGDEVGGWRLEDGGGRGQEMGTGKRDQGGWCDLRTSAGGRVQGPSERGVGC